MTKVARSLPRISVVICTRDRSDSISRAVSSVLEASYPEKEVIVVDQSSSDATAHILADLKRLNRFEYLRSAETGLSRARNLGLAHSTGDIVAFTDDDCVVAKDWLFEIRKVFDADPDIGVVFGAVTAAPHDGENGFIPGNQPREQRIVRTVREKHRIGGMGACMAVTRRASQVLSGFDPGLGAGTDLRAGEETDFCLRALAQGFAIAETPSVHVVHHGFRTSVERDQVVSDYMFGTGAMFAKHVRLRKNGIPILLLHVLWGWVFSRPLITYSAAPRRLFRLASFWRGWRKAWRLPVDRDSQQFVHL